jgi:hypothetical protein
VITTFPQWESNRALLHALGEAGFKGRIAGVVRDDVHGEALGAAGVERVLNPFNDAADFAARTFAAEIAYEEAHHDAGADASATSASDVAAGAPATTPRAAAGPPAAAPTQPRETE